MNHEQIQIAKIEKIPILFKGLFPNISDWDTFINHLNDATQQTDQAVRNNIHSTIGLAHYWSQFTITVDEAQDYHKNLKPIIEVLNPLLDNKFHAAFAIISFTIKEPTIGRHSDPYDVFYLQCIGNADWHIEVGYEEKVYELEPGDLLFVPATLTHEVVSKTPRAAISMMFDI